MNQTDFGALLTALRKGRFDPLEGKVWSQARLAKESGLSEKIIGDIERGKRSTLEPDIMLRLADALTLNTMERKQFFTLFRSVEQHLIPASADDDLCHNCIHLLHSLQFPASLQDPYFNLLAVNQAWKHLYDVPTNFWALDTNVARYNFIRLMLDPASSVKRVRGGAYQKSVEATVNQFRWMSLPYRHTDYYAELFACLMELDGFGRLWMTTQFANEDLHCGLRTVAYRHPRLGNITYTISKSRVETNQGPIYYSMLLPCSAETAERFAEIVKTAGNQVIALARFPATNASFHTASLTDEMSQLFTRTSSPVIGR